MEVNRARSTGTLPAYPSQLQQLNQLLLEMASLRNEAELLNAGVRGLVGLLGIDHAAVLITEQDGAFGRVVSEYPSHGAVGQRLELLLNPLSTEMTRNAGHYSLVQDVENDTRLTPEVRGVLSSLGAQAMLVLPLLVHDQLIGTVGLDIYQKNLRFTDEMITLAQAVTMQMSVSVQNIRLLQQAEERVNQLQKVTSAGQAIHASLQLDAVLGAMLTETPKLFPVDHMIIALYDPFSQQLKDVAQYEAKRINVDLIHAPLVPFDTTLIGDVWHDRKLIRIGDTAQAGVRLRLQDARVRSVMVAPISLRDRQLGVTYVGCLRPHAYTNADAALLEQINGLLAASIDNSQALAESQRAARAQALVNTITAHLQQSSDLEDMIAATAQELGRALGARRARVVLTDDDK
jgi:GAF domain-containing protein